MPDRRSLIISVGLAALLVTGVTSVTSAHRRGVHPLRGFDNIRIDHRGLDAYTALPGDRDLYLGLGGNDVADTGDMHDHVLGGRGDDTLDGGDGRDLVLGGPGDDSLTGGAGVDLIRGERGNDTIFALDGTVDYVRCGPGVDSYTADPKDFVSRDCENDITP
jgi:Ca2+-binding RTX toxin-like protein